MSQQPDYLKLIHNRLDQLAAQMRSMKNAMLSFDDYAELCAAANTDEAKTAIVTNGLSGPKQLLLVALRTYLSRSLYMSEEEERQFLATRDRILAARHHPSGSS